MAKAAKTQEFRGQTNEDLAKKLKDAKEELFNLRFQSATGQLENHGRLRTVKTEIARIYTIVKHVKELWFQTKWIKPLL
jgi:large subunit ribosomal protein L29